MHAISMLGHCFRDMATNAKDNLLHVQRPKTTTATHDSTATTPTKRREIKPSSASILIYVHLPSINFDYGFLRCTRAIQIFSDSKFLFCLSSVIIFTGVKFKRLIRYSFYLPFRRRYMHFAVGSFDFVGMAATCEHIFELLPTEGNQWSNNVKHL